MWWIKISLYKKVFKLFRRTSPSVILIYGLLEELINWTAIFEADSEPKFSRETSIRIDSPKDISLSIPALIDTLFTDTYGPSGADKIIDPV